MTNSSKKLKSEERSIKPRLIREKLTNSEYKKEMNEWKYKGSKIPSQNGSSA